MNRTGLPHRLRRLVPAAAVIGALACRPDAPHERFAAPWQRFVGGNGLAGGVDTSRIVHHGDTLDVWIRFQYAEPMPLPGGPAGTTFVATEAAQSVHCASGRTRDIRMLVRGAGNDSLGAYTTSAGEWQAFTAHPLTENVFVPLCRTLEGKA